MSAPNWADQTIWTADNHWIWSQERIDRAWAEGRLVFTSERMVRLKRYQDESRGRPVADIWADIPPINSMARERMGYPTQKPLALVRRIVEASSGEGGMVLDPFCGCATACIAAQELGRQWVGIDIAPKAVELVRSRMRDELGLLYHGAQRTDMGDLIRYNDPRNKRHLYGEQGGSCAGCGEHFRPQNLEVDHIVAQAQGGTDHLGNLQLLCGHCNRIKGDRGMDYLRAKLQIAA